MALTPLPLNPATGGANIATDLVSSNSYQLVKVVVGDLGTAGLPVGASTNLPVALAGALPAGTNSIGTVINGAGTAIIGKVTTDQTTPGTTDLVHAAQSGNWNVSVVASTSGGCVPYHLVSAATTNATSIKGSAGQFYSMAGYNTNAAPRYLKLYDKASAPTVGTDTPVWVMMLPGNAAGAGANLSLPLPLACTLGLAFAITGGIADNDTTSVGAGDCVIDFLYK